MNPVATGLRPAARPPAALPISRRGPTRRRRFAIDKDLSIADPKRLALSERPITRGPRIEHAETFRCRREVR